MMVLDTVLTTRYDKVANNWDNTISKLGYDRAYEGLFFSLSNKYPGFLHGSNQRVLDVGIGSGSLSIAMIKALQFAGELHGIDISESMLIQAEKNLMKIKYWRNILKQASVERLPYPDNYFDFVLSAHVLEHFKDPSFAISEMLRVLKPSGKILTIMTRQGFWGQWIKWQWKIAPVNNRKILTLFQTKDTYNPEFLSFGQDSLIQWMSSAILVQKKERT
jgi:ubiquinone/menaquinone biosynthesis C-methylase UbiE